MSPREPKAPKGNQIDSDQEINGNLKPDPRLDKRAKGASGKQQRGERRPSGTRYDLYRLLESVKRTADSGERADLYLSKIFREKRLPPKDRLRLLALSQAMFRWISFFPEGLKFSESVNWAALMDGLTVPLKRQVDLRSPLWKGKALPPVSQRLEWLAQQFPGTEIPDAASVLPEWIRKEQASPEDARALAEALLMPAGLWLRSRIEVPQLLENLGKETGRGRVHPSLPEAVLFKTSKDLYYTDAYKSGDFVIQDPASQVIGNLCQARSGERWWDMCAGAGGKTLQLCDSMFGRGVVIATDTHSGRLKELRKRLARAGRFNLEVQQWEGDRAPKGPAFDGVLVDAPCSNSGTLRRNPDLWLRQSTELDELSELQARLLNLAAPRVKPGGRLVYATCSLLRAENEDVVQAFLERFPNFEPVHFDDPLDGRGACEGWVTYRPQDGNHDGTFVAVLRRKPEAGDAPKTAE